MAHFVQAVVSYVVNLSPNTVQAQMNNMMQGATLDPSLATIASVTLTADVTSNPTGTTCQRQLTYALNVPPLITTGLNTVGVANVTGTVESSSAKDTLAGVGVQMLNIAWQDSAGGAHNQTVNMNGVAKVAFGASNVAMITGFTLIAVGSFGANVGQLTIRTARPAETLPIMGGPFGGGYGPTPGEGFSGITSPTLGGSGNVGISPNFRQGGRPTARRGAYIPAGLAGANRGSVLASIPDSFYTRFPDTNNAAQLFYFQNWFQDGLLGYTGPAIQALPVLT